MSDSKYADEKKEDGSRPVAYISSTGGCILECSEEFAALIGQPAQRLVGSDLPSLCKFENTEFLLEAAYQLDYLKDVWKAAIRTNDEPNEYEVVVRKSTKKIRGDSALEATIVPYNAHRRDSLRRSLNAADQKAILEEFKDADVKGNQEPCRVLVVDDSPTALKMMAHIVTRLGHQVTTATNGEDALEHLTNETYDIVIMDINMPRMNGLEASHKFREIERKKRGQHQKIIALSGDISTTLFTEVSNAGFDAFIPKPLTEERFLDVLRMPCKK